MSGHWILSFASQGDELYLGTPEAFTSWEAAVEAAEQRITENVAVDLEDEEDIATLVEDLREQFAELTVGEEVDISNGTVALQGAWHWRVLVTRLEL